MSLVKAKRSAMPALQRLHSLICAAFLSCSITLIMATKVWAQQAQGGKILQESLKATEVSTTAMDNMWKALFASDSALYNQVVTLATALTIIGFFFLMISFAKALQSSNVDKIIEVSVWSLLVIVLLHQNGRVLKHVTLGARGFINQQTKSVLLVQVGTLTIKDALQDVILTDQVQERVKAAFSDCEAKEGEEQIRCLEEGAKQAEFIVKEYEDANFRFPGLRRLSANIKKITQDVREKGAASGAGRRETFAEWDSQISSLVWQSATNSSSRQFLKSFQNWFSYGYEFAMLLTGLLGPLSVAASLIPKQPRAFLSWIIAFFSIGVLKLSYNLIIGFAALYASEAQVQDLGSSGFLLMMSIGAPLISVAVAGGGGAAIFFALGKTTGMVATIIPVGGSLAGGLIRR
jgi:hypothetical protein